MLHDFVANFLPFQGVKEVWKSVKVWHSWEPITKWEIYLGQEAPFDGRMLYKPGYFVAAVTSIL